MDDHVERQFDDFVRLASPQLVRAATLMLAGSRQDAEDTVQETLIIVYRRWRRISDRASAEAYARRTMTRLVWRHHARRKQQQTKFSAIMDEDTSLDIEGHCVAHHDVLAALRALPLRQRQTLVLRFFEDLSVRDTAEILKCSESTVKSQSHDGVNQLRRLLVNIER